MLLACRFLFFLGSSSANRVKSNYLRIGNETNQNRPLESRKSCSSELSHLDIKMNDVLSYMLGH